MIAPGLLVLVTPFVIGILFGPTGVAGVLAGAIVSGVQMAISFSNAGGAWDNAKKYIEGKLALRQGRALSWSQMDSFKRSTPPLIQQL